MKTIFLKIYITSGGREFTEKVMFQTKCKNLEFAVQYFIAHFWGDSYLDGGYWVTVDEQIAMRCESWSEVEEDHVDILSHYFYNV